MISAWRFRRSSVQPFMMCLQHECTAAIDSFSAVKHAFRSTSPYVVFENATAVAALLAGPATTISANRGSRRPPGLTRIGACRRCEWPSVSITTRGFTPCVYMDHVRGRGIELFAAACVRDLEGIVGKWAKGPYEADVVGTSWVK